VNLFFRPVAWEKFLYWQQTDKAMVKKINALINKCMRHPFEGIGKPEPLKGDLSSYWARRIDREHRLVYRATHTALEIVQCRYQY